LLCKLPKLLELGSPPPRYASYSSITSSLGLNITLSFLRSGVLAADPSFGNPPISGSPVLGSLPILGLLIIEDLLEPTGTRDIVPEELLLLNPLDG
jgi:hypothetical protein